MSECVTQNNRKDADMLLLKLSKDILLTVHEETFMLLPIFFYYLKTFSLPDIILKDKMK
jgi:hypothetical protein